MGSKNGQTTNHTKVYVAVWLTLLVLTFVTVEVSYHDYGLLNIFVAMLIATIKGTLVCLFFMHLRYDNRINQVIFISAFVFLAIFVGLSASDIFNRQATALAKIHEIQAPAGNQSAKMNELRVSTPQLVAKGKELFQQNCVTCHGANGQGDGPAASALTPKPRNFTSADGWKNGRAPAQIFKTITEGIQGSAMASFSTFSIDDRWALVHYVRSLTPNPPPDTPQTLAAIGIQEGGATQAKPAEETIELPISFTIDRMVEEAKK
ncbi:MAG: c-type cytochrome [bacterium]